MPVKLWGLRLPVSTIGEFGHFDTGVKQDDCSAVGGEGRLWDWRGMSQNSLLLSLTDIFHP